MPANYRKKLIEVALPLEAINAASAREKSIRHGHPSTLHLWWARRPLAACRAVIFSSLVDDPDDPEANPAFVEACKKLPRGKNAAENDTPRQRLFDFIERLVTWEATTDEAIIGKARELIQIATDGNPPPLLDPFAGGGSIPLEAQRLGLEAHASDLNPVAVVINKALIEIPPKFANMPPVNPRDRAGTAAGSSWKGAAGLAADVRYYGEWMEEKAWERIGHLYPKYNGETVIAWLWARTVSCPNPACGADMPLISTYWLSKKKISRSWLEPVIQPIEKKIRFIIKSGEGEPLEPPKVSRGPHFRCLKCGEIAPDKHLKKEGVAGRMSFQLLSIVTEGTKGRNYHPASDDQEQLSKNANPIWFPQGELANDARAIWCKLYGLTEISDIFTKRQLVALNTFSDLIKDVGEKISKDVYDTELFNESRRKPHNEARSYADALTIYLSFSISRSCDYWTTLCTWASHGEYMGHTFSRQGIPMVWDFAEANPFSGSTGNWIGAIKWISSVLEKLRPEKDGYVIQMDATQVIKKVKTLISTDPPYYDNIGYADLSDVFYVWLRRNIRSIYPNIFSTLLVPKKAELIASPYRFNGNKEAAESFFEQGLLKAFIKFHSIIPKDYPITIFYAFKQEEKFDHGYFSTGWETMLNSLIESNFMIIGTWPVRTEYTSTLKLNVNALSSSIVLVCRKLQENSEITSRREFINILRMELPVALINMQSGNIAPVDLAQASIGPGMAVYSRYSKVLEPDGSTLTVRTALQIINQELDTYLTEQEGEMDTDSRFAVNWFKQFGFNEGGFGQADVLARAKNTSVDGLVRAGILESGAGKVRLLPWSELDPAWDPTTDSRLTVWEAVHHLIEQLNSHGEEGAAHLLAKMSPDLAADARSLAYRLYSICERKNWAEHARDYNSLVVSWSASQEQARELKEKLQQGRLF